MNKKDLIRIVAEKADCPQKVATEIINAYQDTIEQAMIPAGQGAIQPPVSPWKSEPG